MSVIILYIFVLLLKVFKHIVLFVMNAPPTFWNQIVDKMTKKFTANEHNKYKVY